MVLVLAVSNGFLLWLATGGVALAVLCILGVLVCSAIDAEALGTVLFVLAMGGLGAYVLSALIFYL